MNLLPRCKRLLLFARSTIFLAAACFFTALPAHSQQPQLDALAAQTAQALDKAHVKSVVVLDFWGPGLRVTQLGHELADQFSAALSASADSKFRVLDRAQLPVFINEHKLSPLLLGLAAEAFPADEFGAEVLILGRLSATPNNSSLKWELHCVKGTFPSKKIADLQAEFAQTEDMKSLIHKVIPGTDFSQFAQPGEDGVTLPACIHCPPPPFTRPAFKHKIQGMVVLGAVITSQGAATNLIAVRSLPDGLTDSAIKQVSKWLLKPAAGPDGKPVASWTLIEVDFHIR